MWLVFLGINICYFTLLFLFKKPYIFGFLGLVCQNLIAPGFCKQRIFFWFIVLPKLFAHKLSICFQFIFRVDPDTPAYEEPKFIVFYSMLLHLFTLFCFKCKASKPVATMKQDGTMVTVTQTCTQCRDQYIWKSQPPPVRGKYPIGNILLSFAVLMAGASINKVLLVFQHMGLQVYSARTFFRHQKSFLFPIVLHHWETYQADLISKIKQLKDVAWTGDGRFDSVGHSAKYGVYSMFCTTVMKIVHFELVQVSHFLVQNFVLNIQQDTYSLNFILFYICMS